MSDCHVGIVWVFIFVDQIALNHEGLQDDLGPSLAPRAVAAPRTQTSMLVTVGAVLATARC